MEMSMVMPHSLCLQFVQHPDILEEALAHLCCLLLELLDGSLIDNPILVDKMPSGGGLARVHMVDDHDIYDSLLFAHGSGFTNYSEEKEAKLNQRSARNTAAVYWKLLKIQCLNTTSKRL